MLNSIEAAKSAVAKADKIIELSNDIMRDSTITARQLVYDCVRDNTLATMVIDTLINAVITGVSVEEVLDKTFNAMVNSFTPELFNGLDNMYKYIHHLESLRNGLQKYIDVYSKAFAVSTAVGASSLPFRKLLKESED